MKQVITISPDGVISGLQRKPGQGIDLTQFGKADVVRASEIVWQEGGVRGWTVQYMSGPRSGEKMTMEEWFLHEKAPMVVDPDQEIAIFADYDDAVKAEILMLDWWRVRGMMG